MAQAAELTIERYMTATPYTIGADQTLSAAHELMRRHQIRHLPVLQGGKIVGVVSVRDLHLVETLPDVNEQDVTVEEAMSQDVYAVGRDTALVEVAREMAARKLGSAVVLDQKKVVGVFTTVDALHALADILEGMSPTHP